VLFLLQSDIGSGDEKTDAITQEVQQQNFLICFVTLLHKELQRCVQCSLPLDGSYSYTFVYATALAGVEEPLILQQPFSYVSDSILVAVVVCLDAAEDLVQLHSGFSSSRCVYRVSTQSTENS
jgi:hypothetical protein